LLAFVSLELGPKLEVIIKYLECLTVILGKPDLLPELCGEMRPLDGLHVEVAMALHLEHGGVASVSKGAGVTRT